MYEKQRKYRLKCLKEQRCAHCGKECFPWASCEKRRSYRRIQYTLRTLLKAGAIVRLRRGVYASSATPDAPFPGPRGGYRTNPEGQPPKGLKKFLRTVDEPWAKEMLKKIEVAQKAWRVSK
jgi:hypothetical protein